MMQPIGSLSPSITPEQSFYLRVSPLVCTLEALSTAIQFAYFAVILRNPLLAARYVAGLGSEELAKTEQGVTNRQAL